MRFTSLLAALGILAASTVSAFAVPAVGGLRAVADSSHIELVAKKKKKKKAKKKKDMPGKCGPMKFYDKKKKKCVSK
jgi:hypothetical protein